MDNSNLPIASSSSSSPHLCSVVVDSLLCFVHNFRHLPHLRSVLIRHFPVPSFVRSVQLLTQLSPDPSDLLFPFCPPLPEDVHLLLHSLLLRFDRLSASGQAPIFAASDLFSLPLRPNFVTSSTDAAEVVQDKDGTKAGRVAVEDEIRHIRFMLQQLFWLQQQLPNKQKNSSSPLPPFLDFAQHAVPSFNSASASSVSLFAQFGQSLFSSPECPTARPLPATTPKDGQTLAINGTDSATTTENVRKTMTNSGKGMSPSKGRGRLDNVVEKLTRERAISRKGTTDGGKEDEGQQQQRMETMEDQRNDETAQGNGGEDSEGKEGQQQKQQKKEQREQQVQHLLGGLAATTAMASSSYAMQMLQQLAIGAGGFGEIMGRGQQRQQLQMDEETKEVTGQLTKRNDLEEEEAEERNEPILEEEEEDENYEGISGVRNEFSEERDEEGEAKKRMSADLEEQTMEAESPTLSEGSFVEMYGRNEKEGEEKPLLCNWPNCSKRFRNKFLLKKHRFIHTGEKPHNCPFCPKKFNRRDNLLRHKKTHVQNGLNEMSGQKRRHNMLYGVSAEEAILSGMILPMESGTSTDKQRRVGTKRKAPMPKGKGTDREWEDGTDE